MKHLLNATSSVESIRYFVVRPGRSVGEVGGSKWMFRYYRVFLEETLLGPGYGRGGFSVCGVLNAVMRVCLQSQSR